MDVAILNPEGSIYIIKWAHLVCVFFWVSQIINYNYFFYSTLPNLSQSELLTLIRHTFAKRRKFLLFFTLGSLFTGLMLLSSRVRHYGVETLNTSWGVCVLLTLIISLFMIFNELFITQKKYDEVLKFTDGVDEFNVDHNFLMHLVGEISRVQRINYIFLVLALFYILAAQHLQFSITSNNFNLIYILIGLLLTGIQILFFKSKVILNFKTTTINIICIILIVLTYSIVELLI